VEALARTCAEEGFTLAPRLPIYAEYLDRPGFLDPSLHARVTAHRAAEGGHHVG
jgi:hypothetical protein